MGQSVESALIALTAIFFRLIARILTIFDKKYRIWNCCDKRESYLIVLQSLALTVSLWLSMALCDSHSGPLDVSRQKRVLFNCFATKQCLGMLKMSLSAGSLWLSVTPTLALTGSHCHSLAYSGPLWLTIAL